MRDTERRPEPAEDKSVAAPAMEAEEPAGRAEPTGRAGPVGRAAATKLKAPAPPSAPVPERAGTTSGATESREQVGSNDLARNRELQEALDDIFRRSPITAVTLLHRNFEEGLQGAILRGSGYSLDEDQVRGSYQDFMTAVLKIVANQGDGASERIHPQSFVNYCFGIAFRLGARGLRGKRKREKDSPGDADSLFDALECQDHSEPFPGSNFELQELREMVLHDKTEREAEIINRYFFWFDHERSEGCQPTERELAAEFNITRYRLRKVLDRAKQQLRPYFPNHTDTDT